MIRHNYRYAKIFADIYIGRFTDDDLTWSELENRKIWQSLPVDLAAYFVVLDKLTIEDDFFIAVGRKCVSRIQAAGFSRAGDIVQCSEADVAHRAELSGAERRRLSRFIERLGLHYEADVTRWLDYRGTVDPQFRLTVPHGVKLPQLRRSAFEI